MPGSLPLYYPKFKAFDTNGKPLVGGKVYTYNAGATTAQKTYGTASHTVTNTNPVVLNAAGEADIYATGTIKLILKDSSDHTLWTVDNYQTPRRSILLDLDGDTKIDVEPGADIDDIYFYTSGDKKMTINNKGIIPAPGVPITDADGDTCIFVEESADEDIIRFDTGGASGVDNVLLLQNGKVFMGGETSNAFNTQGLTINQGTNDDEAISFKSDIAHGTTSQTETDTFGALLKHSAANGGIRLVGYTADKVGMTLRGVVRSEDTGHTATSKGCVVVEGYTATNTNLKTPSANAVIFTVRSGTSAKFMVDAEGDIFYDGTSTTYDTHDDAQAISDLNQTLAKRDGQTYGLEELQTMKVIQSVDKDGRVFLSHKRKSMLELGAIAELYRVVSVLCEKAGITYSEAKKLTM